MNVAISIKTIQSKFNIDYLILLIDSLKKKRNLVLKESILTTIYRNGVTNKKRRYPAANYNLP